MVKRKVVLWILCISVACSVLVCMYFAYIPLKVKLLIWMMESGRMLPGKASFHLTDIGEPAVRPLIPMLSRADEYCNADEVAVWSANALAEIGQPAVPALVEALEDATNDINVRRISASILGETGDSKAIPSLKTALEHKDTLLRYFAAKSLASFGEEAAIPTLIEAAGNTKLDENNWWIRPMIIRKFLHFGRETITHVLTEALKDPSGTIRMAGLRGLNPNAVDGDLLIPVLIDTLEDEHPDIRIEACKKLQAITGYSKIPFDGEGPPKERQNAVERWKEWWREREAANR